MSHYIRKLLLFFNYILIILHMGWLTNDGIYLSPPFVIPLLIASIMLIDISYIASCSIKDNRVLFSFCGLLALDSWYLILSFEPFPFVEYMFRLLSPVVLFASIRFVLIFLFQGSGYKYQKTTNILLAFSCICSIIGLMFSNTAFDSMYGMQFLVSIICFFFIISYHYKRVFFIFNSEIRSFFISLSFVILGFITYYFATKDISGHISNFGIYLPVMLFFISVHAILLKEHRAFPLSVVFKPKQSILILTSAVVVLGCVILCLEESYGIFIVLLNLFFALVFLCNIILEQNLKKGESRIIKENGYYATLEQFQREEVLKAEFANFLHDDILQDLLSIKNMMEKSHTPEVHNLILDTLGDLNDLIRNQMQDYHPIILKNLTIKENFQNLIETVDMAFPKKRLSISFECSDKLFLVEPYTALVYRFIKELLTNVYKHSDARQVWLTLIQAKGEIKLSISDNGTVDVKNIESADITIHKGIFSIKEQVNGLGGAFSLSDNIPHGICVEITLPMKGEDSYKYFINR